MNLASPSTGTHQTLKAMDAWSGLDDYFVTERDVFYGPSGDVAGYFKAVDNLRLVVIRNAGFDVVHDQPENSLFLLEQFIYDNLKKN